MEDRVGVIPPVYNMLAFGRYPLSIYSPMIQFLLSWIIPSRPNNNARCCGFAA